MDEDFATIPCYLLIILSCLYFLVSLFFLLFPDFLHKVHTHKFQADQLLIGHRGGAGEKTENTLTAFRHCEAVARQADIPFMLELDIHITKDNVPVVVHDERLDRLCEINPGSPSFVHEYNFEELPPIKKTLEVEFSEGFTFENDGAVESIPTLESVFKKFEGVPMNIDIKINNDRLISSTKELICRFNRQELTVWGNDKAAISNKMYSLDPSIPLFFSSRKVYLSFLFFALGLLPFIPIRESYLEVPLPIKINRKTTRMFIESLLKKIVGFIFLNYLFLRHMQKRGIRIFYWVPNTEKEFQAATNSCANGIITDFPKKFADWIN